MSALHEVAVPRPDVHEVEVVAKATRRRFTAEYKRKILREADACTEPGAIGALLRREGLYSSHIPAPWGTPGGFASTEKDELIRRRCRRSLHDPP